MTLVMYTTTGPAECCDTSHVVSLDTLHGTDGLVDTTSGTSDRPTHVYHSIQLDYVLIGALVG